MLKSCNELAETENDELQLDPHCRFCRGGEVDGNPLLLAGVAGEMFLGHRSCLDREWKAMANEPELRLSVMRAA